MAIPKLYSNVGLSDRIKEMDMHYIYKPMREIRRTLLKMFLFEFATCTFLSFHILWIPMIPTWLLVIYRTHMRISYLTKYNISYIKILVFILIVLALEFILANFIRGILWSIITGVWI